MSKLPNKMSALIRIALADLRKIERSKRYGVDMNSWHTPLYGKGRCLVCFAGSVMAKTLSTSPYADTHPAHFGPDEGKLRALDALRLGKVLVASGFLGINIDRVPRHLWNVNVQQYGPRSKGRFKRQMAKLARDLERAGL